MRRARRHGSGKRADLAEALAQSKLIDHLAASAVTRAAHARPSSPARGESVAESVAKSMGELARYREAGLIWLRRLATAERPAENIPSRGTGTPT